MEATDVQGRKQGETPDDVMSMEGAQQRISEINDQVMRFIRERPGTCLLGAMALGFVIGRIASR